jgi:type I restriction enzyme M protein
MIDARGVYRKVTRKIYDFSPEQLRNLTSIVWLYRGQQDRFINLVAEHLANSVAEGVRSAAPARTFLEKLAEAKGQIANFFKASTDERAKTAFSEFETAAATLRADVQAFTALTKTVETAWGKAKKDMSGLKAISDNIAKSAEASHDLVRDIDHAAKLFSRAVDLAERELGAKENGIWSARDVRVAQKALEDGRGAATEQLKLIRYFYRHAHWLSERFPDAEPRDVPGLVKLVSQEELEKHDWSLTPGRYVGVAPEQEDEDFDFEETMRKIHVELADLAAEAAALAAKIAMNFEGLGL